MLVFCARNEIIINRVIWHITTSADMSLVWNYRVIWLQSPCCLCSVKNRGGREITFRPFSHWKEERQLWTVHSFDTMYTGLPLQTVQIEMDFYCLAWSFSFRLEFGLNSVVEFRRFDVSLMVWFFWFFFIVCLFLIAAKLHNLLLNALDAYWMQVFQMYCMAYVMYSRYSVN